MGRTFQLEAWVESIDGRKIWLAGEMREGDDVIAARALFIEVDRAHFLRARPLPDDWFGGPDPKPLPY